MDKKNALKVENLTKIYSKKTANVIRALNNLNLEVKVGEIFGLLGPNGAGKTTFLSILAGTVIKNSGSVNVWGYDLDKDPRQVRSSIGIVPQEPLLFAGTVNDNIALTDPDATSDEIVKIVKSKVSK